jgi:hypothetical protein
VLLVLGSHQGELGGKCGRRALGGGVEVDQGALARHCRLSKRDVRVDGLRL